MVEGISAMGIFLGIFQNSNTYFLRAILDDYCICVLKIRTVDQDTKYAQS